MSEPLAKKHESPLERLLGWVLVLLMGTAVLNVLWQVFTRFVLASPSSYTEELARFLLIWIALLGGAYASGKRLHLAIDLLPARLGWRWQRVVAATAHLSVAAFAGSVLVYGGFKLVALTLSLGQTSAALNLSIGYVYMVLPISGLAFMWFALRDLYLHMKGVERT